MNTRRTVLRLGVSLGAALALPATRAAQSRSLADPLRLGVDDALFDSGFAGALQRGFGHDTGVAVQLLHGPATAVIAALERGEHDATLTNAPDAEQALVQQGLAHDRRAVAVAEFVLVGPSALAKSLAAGNDVALALSRIAQAQIPFLTRPDGCGTHLVEQAAWRAAKTAPGGAWYRAAADGAPVLAQARSQDACTLVERGVFAASPPARGHGVLVQEDPRLAVDVHAMRSFRTAHPAAKLFVGWITGEKGRAVVASHRGYRRPQG